MTISYYIAGFNKIPVKVIMNEDGSSNHTLITETTGKDYEEYQQWLAESNTPEPAEETL
jgi:hypothetical protein